MLACIRFQPMRSKTRGAGGGLTFGMEETFLPYLQRGELEAVLEEYCPSFAGFFLYFAARRNAPPKLRALIDHFRFTPQPRGRRPR